MADTPISSDPTLTNAQISGSDLVPVVDVSEAAASDKNKNTTFTYMVAYFDANLTAFADVNHNHVVADITDLTTSTVTITGTWTFNDLGTGDLDEIDLSVGGASYGVQQIGDAAFGRTSHTATDGAPAYNLDGTFFFQNATGPVTGDIEFIFLDSSGLARFALPKSGVGNATYNPRSMLIAGPAVADSDVVTVGYWNTQGIFHNLTCDTGTNGADLGVQHDLEVEGQIWVDTITESTTAAGVTIETVLIKDGLVDTVDVSAFKTAYDAHIGGDIHIDWTVTGAEVIHADRYTDTTYTAGDFNHDDLANIPANDHIDWTSTIENLATAGTVTANGFTSSNTTALSSDADNSLLAVIGGATGGAKMWLFGGSHSGQANDIEFLTSPSTKQLAFDYSGTEWDFQANDITTTGNVTATEFHGDGSNLTGIGGAFSADAQTQITPTTAIVLDEATGDEVALDLSYTVNKATSGGSTGIFLDATLTSAPGFDYLIKLQAGGFDRFYVTNSGTAYIGNTTTISSLSISGNSLYKTTSSSSLSLFGGGYNNGGNVVLYGGSHSTQADDIEFRTDTTVVGHYDASATKWDFQTSDLVTLGDATFRTLTTFGTSALVRSSNTAYLSLSGSTSETTGANLLLYGEGATGQQYDVRFRSATTTELHFDASANLWDFQANAVTTTGSGTFSDLILTDLAGQILGDSSANSLVISASTTPTNGGNIVLYGGTHATKPGVLELRSGSTSRMSWDTTFQRWDFGDADLLGIGDIDMVNARFGNLTIDTTNGIHREGTDSTLGLSGGSSINSGANIVLYGSTHGTTPFDVLFRSNNTTTELHFDASANAWDFQANDIVTTGDVGIGTNTPSERLTVQVDSTSVDVPVVLLEAPGGNGGRIVMDSDIQAGNWQINWDTGAVEQLNITQSGSGAAEFYIYPMVAGAGGTIGLNTDTIYAQGKVGINETSPTYQLSVKASQGQYNPCVALYGDDVASGWARLNLYPRNSGNTGYDTAGYLAGVGTNTYLRAGSGTSDTLRLHADGSSGSIIASIAGATRTTTASTKFQTTVPLLVQEAASATTDVAGYGQLWVKNETPNELWFTDDAGTDVQVSMTTGTFTPVIWDNSQSSSEGQTYTTQKGYYWRIGDLVHIWLELTVSSFGTLTITEQARIGGLPFTSSNDSNQGAKGVSCVYFTSMNLPASGQMPTGRIPNNQSYILMERQGGSTTNAQALLLSQFSSDGSVVLQGFYEIA